jgi:hypothetical protein
MIVKEVVFQSDDGKFDFALPIGISVPKDVLLGIANDIVNNLWWDDEFPPRIKVKYNQKRERII